MKKLFRSTRDSKLAGVCGGIGEWLNIDATIVRLVFVIGALFGFGSFILIYILMAILVPKNPYNELGPIHNYHY
jgi:phage shock protein C